ncbi:MAG: hypothetical protein FJZ95_08360 [Chloroflexi bacterium]|nr:hypothetical protein [Chloroflexota bacterium]
MPFRRRIEVKGRKMEEYIVWGVWAPRQLKTTYQVLAARMGVPTSTLVNHVLSEWLSATLETLDSDTGTRVERNSRGESPSRED